MGVTSTATVISPADDYSLVTLDTVKAELNIDSANTTNDDWLNRTIVQVSRSIRTYCNRAFQIETIRELAHPQWYPLPYQAPYALRLSGDCHIIQLSRVPIANFAVIPLAVAAAVNDNSLNLGAEDGLPGVVSAPGLPLGTIATPDGDPQLSKPVSAAMPAGTPIGFGIEVKQQLPSSSDNERGLSAGIDYLVDADAGQLVRLAPVTGGFTAWEQLPLTITYSAGYAAVPEDVVAAAITAMQWRWAMKGRDPTIRETMQPGISQVTYFAGGIPMAAGLPQEVAAMLAAYREPLVG
jgi:hypothetical protein